MAVRIGAAEKAARTRAKKARERTRAALREFAAERAARISASRTAALARRFEKKKGAKEVLDEVYERGIGNPDRKSVV